MASETLTLGENVMSDTPEILEVDQYHRLPGVSDYSKRDAEMLVDRTVKSDAEQGVYGMVTGVQGYVDRQGSQKPYYGVVVDWATKPKAELSGESILFRRDLDKHYPLMYGAELEYAKNVYGMYSMTQDMKQQSTAKNKTGRGK